MPPVCSKRSAACFAIRRGGEHGGTGAIAKQARADENAGIVIEVKRRAADFDADRQNRLATPRAQQRLRRAQVGQRGAASLAHQIEREHIRL
jgi:hypothetical protein